MFLALLLSISSAQIAFSADPTDTFSDTLAYKKALWARRTALELEIELIQAQSESYYLILDLPKNIVELKSGGNILHTATIQNASGNALTQYYKFSSRIDPVTPEPANQGLRHRGRHLPIDFVTRLIEGPRRASRLYFNPPLILKASGIPSPTHIPHFEIAAEDIKSLGAALHPGDQAIFIPALPANSGSPP